MGVFKNLLLSYPR